MSQAIFNYDEMSDTLYISFAPGEHATGIELNDHILLRINKCERRAVGITLFEYSFLAQNTEMGHRSFSLSALSDISPELREIVLHILQHPPVSVYSVSCRNHSYYDVAVITGRGIIRRSSS